MSIANAVLNPEGKVDYYICTECSRSYKFRYKDTTLCCTCLLPTFNNTSHNLSEEKSVNESFRNNWVNKKTKKK